jgi:hypothetical protein
VTLLVIKSTDSAAPALSGQAGKLLDVLDSCLIVNNVYTTADDSSFTDRNTEARLEGGTAFNLLPTPASGDRLYIGMPVKFARAKFDLATLGVGGTYVWEYWNGSAWTSLSVTDGTSGFTAAGTVTWTAPGSWATNAVNSVTQYWVRVRASANPSTTPTVNYLTVGGWTRAYSGTNKAAYRQASGSNGFLLRVDDTGTTTARGVGYESMTDVDTGAGPFPTSAQVSGGLYWAKSNTADATARPWIVACSEKLFHYQCNHNSASDGLTSQIHTFGDIKSYKSGDVFATIHIGALSATMASNNTMHLLATTGTSNGHYMARTYTQLGTSIQCSKHTDSAKNGSSNLGAGGVTYPHPVDGGLYLAPLWINESASVVRGELPGLWAPLHNKPLSHLDTFNGTGALAGKTFITLNMYSIAQAFLETSDTWLS